MQRRCSTAHCWQSLPIWWQDGQHVHAHGREGEGKEGARQQLLAQVAVSNDDGNLQDCILIQVQPCTLDGLLRKPVLQAQCALLLVSPDGMEAQLGGALDLVSGTPARQRGRPRFLCPKEVARRACVRVCVWAEGGGGPVISKSIQTSAFLISMRSLAGEEASVVVSPEAALRGLHCGRRSLPSSGWLPHLGLQRTRGWRNWAAHTTHSPLQSPALESTHADRERMHGNTVGCGSGKPALRATMQVQLPPDN